VSGFMTINRFSRWRRHFKRVPQQVPNQLRDGSSGSPSYYANITTTSS
jgi:hypothetical protein